MKVERIVEDMYIKKRILIMIVALSVLTACNAAWRTYHAVTGVKKVTIEELRTMLDNPDIIIIDVRDTKDWEGSDIKIPGALREDPYHPENWADKYDMEARIILYCS